MDKTQEKRRKRLRRHRHVRRKLAGTAERPRMAIFRSLKHIYAQVIDDDAGKTIAAASTRSEELRGEKSGGNVGAAKKLGALIAEKAKARGVSRVAFDRGGYKFHGRVKALAEAAREAGLSF